MEGPTAASPSPLVTYIFAASLRGQEPLGDRRSRLGELVTDDEQSPDPNQSWSLHGEIHSRRHAWLTKVQLSETTSLIAKSSSSLPKGLFSTRSAWSTRKS